MLRILKKISSIIRHRCDILKDKDTAKINTEEIFKQLSIQHSEDTEKSCGRDGENIIASVI